MESQVEKMYKTIFGEFAPNCSLCVKLVECEIINNTHNCNKFQCDYQRLFTAEKQLELIKWLSDISSYFSVHYDRYKGTYNVQTGDGGLYVTNNLSEAIASRINIIWNDLSKKQRTQIKEILE